MPACSCPAELRREDEYRRQKWHVTAYRENRSAFNGYHRTPSAYSEVRCRACGARWRTKAAYVDRIPGSPPDWGRRA